MRRTRYCLLAIAMIVTVSCQSPLAPHESDQAAAATVATTQSGGPTAANGGGHYFLQNVFETQFAFSAVQNNGGAHGELHHQLTIDGVLIGFRGYVTCVTMDPVNHRAWIGGVITENLSEDPAFQTARHQPGHDIWFRVLDTGEGSDAPPDRTTFTGFEGDLGIQTSAEYCAVKPWADNNARTWPVTGGNIQVKP
jgi:hypothetical protein